MQKHSVAIFAVCSSEIELILQQDSRGEKRVGRLICNAWRKKKKNIVFNGLTIATSRLELQQWLFLLGLLLSPLLGCSLISFEIVFSDMATPTKRNRSDAQRDQENVPGSGGESQNLEIVQISQSEGGELTEELTLVPTEAGNISVDQGESSPDRKSSGSQPDTVQSSDAEIDLFTCDEGTDHSGESELFLFNCASFSSCSFADESDDADENDHTKTRVANSNGEADEKLPTDPKDEYEFQSKICLEIDNMPRCIECYYYPNQNDTLCRFIGFRELGFGTQNGKYRFPTSKKCYEKAGTSSEQPVQSNTETSAKSRQLSPVECAYILFYTRFSFWNILKAEKRFKNEYRRATGKKEKDIPLKVFNNDREVCDVCLMGIFNFHAICRRCGFTVCMACFNDRLNEVKYDEETGPFFDQYQWFFCTDLIMANHQPAAMDLCYFHEELHPSKINETTKNLGRRFSECSTEIMRGGRGDRCFPNVRHFYTNNRNLLILQEPYNEASIGHFRKHWRNALPVLVQNVKINSEYWRPSFFRQQFRHAASGHDLQDCCTGQVLCDVPYLKFWNGFDDRRKRMRDSDGNTARHLKLRDWPSNNTLPELIPSTCADFYSAAPMPSYVHRTNAAFNLLSFLPDNLLKPDLKPKLHIAYEMFPKMDVATTNLHSDITDALNILTWTSIPKNVSKQRMHDDILRVLAKEGLDEKMMNMARERINDVGALWTIFKPDDSDKLRQYIIQHFDEPNEPGSDPIHDNTHYLNANVRADLAKHGIQPITFLQMRNDAVYIPAGAAHQVLNLKCCIKAALDFVSPEGIDGSLRVANELRKLSVYDINHGDKLQIHNIIYYSTLEAIEALEKVNSSPT
ncbi:Lysine-specific demethylase 3A [Trichinella zimbabwensis]|uniref:Lysine-specific demethylase 3A n=1 Tax=Trichinella zimbabwensis TaxID=268475 RepID=A0A0V1HZ14_9BILA|nr:Lysine-specific demethylase 3A [Trichinella zimbabwensis]